MSPNMSQTTLSSLIIASLASNVSARVIFQDLHLVPDLAKAHGSVMGVAFVIIFPLGAVLMRVAKFKGAVWVHAALQLLGWVLMIAGLALGVRLASIVDYLHNNTHTILGTVVVVMMLIQPFIGFTQHYLFRKKQKQTPASHLHIWYGRLLILLGMINGGLGLRLAGNSRAGTSRAGTIAYGVVAGVVGVAYLAFVSGFEWKKAKRSAKFTPDGGMPDGEREEAAKQTA